MNAEDPKSAPGRVLMIAASDRRRGAEIVTEQLVAGLTARGWDCEATCLTRSNDSAIVSLPALTDVEPSDAGRLNLSILRALRRKIARSSPDVIVAMGGSTLRYAVLARSGSTTRLAYFAIGEPRYWYRSRFAMAMNRWLLGRVDRVLAVSHATQSQLVELDPGLASRTSVWHTGVDERFFSIERTARARDLRVLFVGSLSAEKDPILAVEAVAEVPGCRLRMVGTGPMMPEVESTIDALSLRDRIELAGPTTDVAASFRESDVLLLTSRTEGLPGVVLEAAAAGLAVVAVDVGGIAEAVAHQDTGIVVERSKEAIVGALSRLAGDQRAVDRMGTEARSRASSRFRLADAVDRFDSILRQELT